MRTLALEQFFVGSFEVALAGDEILTAIQVPALPAHTAAAYLKYGLLERPSVGVAVAVTALPDQVQEVRVAVGCVGPTPRRLRDVEGLLSQKELPEVRARLDAAGALAGSAADAVTDLHGSVSTRSISSVCCCGVPLSGPTSWPLKETLGMQKEGERQRDR
jgi:CO/xanthine dehydrogenase FAD-binding subunit